TVVPIRTTTTWPNGLQSKVETDYDTGFTVQDATYDSSGNWTGACTSCGFGLYATVEATREFAFGNGAPGPLIRTTSTPHLALGNTSYLNNNLLDLLASKGILDANGTTLASTAYAYDESGFPLSPSSISTQHDSLPPSSPYRGNQTTVN